MALTQSGFRRLARAIRGVFGGRPSHPAGTCGRRAVLLHLDGLGRRALDLAMRTGQLPFLQRVLESGTHQLTTYRAGAPASTAAFQAALLYGRTEDVPGYLWYDKRLGRNMRMDRSDDVSLVESRHRRREPGLLAGGKSYATLFTGDARAPTMNLARAKHLELNLNGRHWPVPFTAAVNAALGMKLAARLLGTVPRDLLEGLRWSAKVGRVDWEWRLFGMRALTDAMREIATWSVAADMALGVPVVYACIVDYDENAHRRGPFAGICMRNLRAADRTAEIVFAAAEAFPEMRYDVYVLSDHGQVASIPFAALDGRDLPAFLRAAAEGSAASERHLRLRRLGDRLPPGPGWIAQHMARRDARTPAGVEIVDAGDIAHLYFTGTKEPLPLDAIERLQPRILAALRASAAVPFFAARGAMGAVVLASRRDYHLADGLHREALSEVPAFRGPDRDLLLRYVERLMGMPSSGDLVLYGNRGADDPAVAFSWEFGSHGGLGPDEVEAFVLHPAEVGFDFGGVTLPEALHPWFIRYRPDGVLRTA